SAASDAVRHDLHSSPSRRPGPTTCPEVEPPATLQLRRVMPLGIGRADVFGCSLLAYPPGSPPYSPNDLPRGDEAQQNGKYQKKSRHGPQPYGTAFEPSEN